MKLDFPDIARASRLAVTRALFSLRRKGAEGEANRAFVMSDRWRDYAAQSIALNAERLHAANSVRVVFALSRQVQIKILQTEIASRKAAL